MATIISPWRLLSSCYTLSKNPSHHNNYNSRPANHRIVCCALNTESKEGLKDVSRKEALRRLDLELERGNEKEALAIVTSLQGKPRGLRGFGGASQVVYGGGVESLIIDTVGRMLSKKYRDRVAQHEAGHFLIAYLLGVLPKGYSLSSLDAFKKNGSLNIQAGTAFVDFQFLEEVNSGKLSSGTLSKYSCIALAGVATEYLLFGFSEGGLSDIQQLDNLFKSLSFTQKKSDSQVRWAVLNTVTLLRRHEQVRCKLAEAMAFGKSVGECIDIIENELTNVSDI